MLFTDPRLYVMGVGTGYMTDPVTGDILYWSDKMQEGNITIAASDNVLNAGIGNGPVIITETDPNIGVNVTAADYSEFVKAASAGAGVVPGAPTMTCKKIAASGTSISVGTDGGTPVAGPGMKTPVAYMQEVGAASPVAVGGTAYEIDPATGDITGFVAASGKEYLVYYYVSQANATITTYTTNMKGKVVRFVLSRPIYVNYDPATKSGDMYGWLHEIIPALQLMPDGASNSGSQTAYTTTGISGRAITFDAQTVAGDCGECGAPGSPLMYRVIVPCDASSGVDGIIGVVGGTVSLKTGETFQLDPAVIVGGKMSYRVPASDFTYESASTSVATVGAATGMIAAAGTGSTQITVSYAVGDATYQDTIDVDVSST